MIFLQIVLIMLITCYFSMASNNNTMTISNIKKRDEDLNDTQNKSKALYGTPEQKVKNLNDSTVLLHLKDDQFNSDEKTKHSSIRNNSTTYGNNTFSQDMSTVQSGNKTVCAFSFDKNDLLSARNNLSRPYYLFYVNLNIQDLNLSSLEQKDQSLHWQYVRKKEQFLVQLPVDFDLLTYNLLVIDKEQTTLNLTVFYNHSTCAHTFEDQLDSIRLLLWNELFYHNTSFYLCNRNFTHNTAREFLYNSTTIWVGYDLNCSEVSSKGGFNYILLTKDHLPLVIPLFCYFLSLQFVWIFALLDFKTDPATIHTDLSRNKINIGLCSKTIQGDQNLSYKRKDRPYGLKRFVVKILYGKYCPKAYIISPGIRLLVLLWCFILLPFGLYRTINRYTLSNDIYKNYCQVVRTSEPMFKPNCNSSDEHYSKNKKIDIIYATLFPLLYIVVGYTSYKFFLTNHSRTCCFLPENKEDQELITKTNRVSDRFNFFNYQFCKFISIKYLCSKICCKEGCCKFCAYVFTFFFSFIYCIFPIIPFSCCTHVQYCTYKHQSNQTNSSNEETRQATISNASTSRSGTIHSSSVLTIQQTGSSMEQTTSTNLPNQNTTTQNQSTDSTNQIAHPTDPNTAPRNPTTNQTKCYVCIVIFRTIVHFIIIFGQYFLCLRPVISTFTFILRSFTYLVFVVLVVRTHILNYTLLIVTTLTYFVKYLHELVNMNAEILKYIFFIYDERRSSNSDGANNEPGDHTTIEYVDEEMFDYIYQRLLFVRKKLHLIFQKMVIVFMYLFITIETFITKKESLTGPSFQHILEFLLIIIGPYAISIFLKKINKEDFLTDNNKTEIEKEHTNYETMRRRINEQNAGDSPTDGVNQRPLSGLEIEQNTSNRHHDCSPCQIVLECY